MDPLTRPLKPGDPEHLGRFDVFARLGAGGMGVAYLARTDSGEAVVVKAVQLDFADDPEARRRFRSEVLATAAVESPFVPQVLASDLTAERQWVAIEYISGPTLAEVVARQGPLAPARQLALGAVLASGLTSLHAKGVIHRDLKPGNIICTNTGPRLIDFGVATWANIRGVTRTGALAPGSPGWMAPEQLDPLAEPTPAIDVFAWGCVCWYAAAAHSPFEAATPDQSLKQLRQWSTGQVEIPNKLHPALADVVVAALDAVPSQRPTAADIATHLGGAGDVVTGELVATAWDPMTTGEVAVPTIPATSLAVEQAAIPQSSRIRRSVLKVVAALFVASAAGIILAVGAADFHDPAQSQAASTPQSSPQTASTTTPNSDSNHLTATSDETDGDSSAASRTTAPASSGGRSSNQPPPGYGGNRWVGYGAVKLGMTREQLLDTGEVANFSGSPDAPCVRYSLRAGGYAGYSVALKRVVYIEFTGKMATSQGIRIGSRADEVFTAYPAASADRMGNLYPQVAPGVFYTIGVYDDVVELLVLESDRQDCAM
ncbi:protein kinase [Nocardioides sp. YIM 152588]|uniref:protein kinase domain-containing protein n=1 Tax=Nocardioides sp. YIM 152588 TaxID=3158259 RepID=UPI0032E44449